jgi:cytochrome c oxidase subunit 2
MTVLLILTVLVLVAISIWQITKIFELSQPKKVNTQVADDDDNRWNGQLMFAFLIFIYGITLFSFWKWGDVMLPSASSEHGIEYDNLLWISFAIIFFTQTITQGLLHYFAYKFRGEKGKKAFFYADNDRLEAIWTIIPVIVLAGLILYGLYTWTDIMTVEENEEALVVELYAQQFNWKARYAGDDGVLGDANVRFLQDFDGKNLVGIDATDPNGFDDVVVQELHLPSGREVIFKMRSQDVLHSAYMPHFRAQMNCVPGMVTQFAFTPKYTTEEMREQSEVMDKTRGINKIRSKKGEDLYEFDYVLLCNKICGASHYSMQMKIIVEEEEDYKKWLAEQATYAEKL